jgi:hypothetical protein
MKICLPLLFFLIPVMLPAQSKKNSDKLPDQNQFILFDKEFTYTKEDADNSKPSKSHYYVYGHLLNPDTPKDWTSPIDYRNGTVHIRFEVIEKPSGNAPTTWSLCYIPNKGQGNGYGCTNSSVYLTEGVYEKDVPMTSFWENESIVWSEGIKQMDLVVRLAVPYRSGPGAAAPRSLLPGTRLVLGRVHSAVWQVRQFCHGGRLGRALGAAFPGGPGPLHFDTV